MRYIEIEDLLIMKSTWGSPADLWTDSKLKQDFRDYFHNKCWYTEKNLAGFDVDIDHFRPKNEVKKYKNYEYNFECKDSGYDWLKNDPTNYRASCIYANRPREKGGKSSYFPLCKGSAHMTSGGGEIERGMLLDPCNRADVNLMTFCGGNVEAASTKSEDKERVKVSSELYNMETFRDERVKVWNRVKRAIDRYNRRIFDLASCVEELSEYVGRDSEYSACAIACVNSMAPDEIKDRLNLEL